MVIYFQFPITSQTPFFPLLCAPVSTSIEKKMEDENVLVGKYSSSLHFGHGSSTIKMLDG